MTESENEYELKFTPAGIRQLHAHELQYELLIRGEENIGTVPEIREALIECLDKEPYQEHPYTFDEDLIAMMQSAQWILKYQESYNKRVCAGSITKLEARVVHMRGRLQRMVFPQTESDDITAAQLTKYVRYKSWFEHVISETSKVISNFRIASEKKEKGVQLTAPELKLTQSALIDFVGLDGTLNPDYVVPTLSNHTNQNFTQSHYFDPLLNANGGSSTPVDTNAGPSTGAGSTNVPISATPGESPETVGTRNDVQTTISQPIPPAPGVNYIQSMTNAQMLNLNAGMHPFYSVSTNNPFVQPSTGNNVQNGMPVHAVTTTAIPPPK